MPSGQAMLPAHSNIHPAKRPPQPSRSSAECLLATHLAPRVPLSGAPSAVCRSTSRSASQLAARSSGAAVVWSSRITPRDLAPRRSREGLCRSRRAASNLHKRPWRSPCADAPDAEVPAAMCRTPFWARSPWASSVSVFCMCYCSERNWCYSIILRSVVRTAAIRTRRISVLPTSLDIVLALGQICSAVNCCWTIWAILFMLFQYFKTIVTQAVSAVIRLWYLAIIVVRFFLTHLNKIFRHQQCVLLKLLRKNRVNAPNCFIFL